MKTEIRYLTLRVLLNELKRISKQRPESLDAEVSVELVENDHSITPLVEGVRIEKSEDLRLINTTPFQILLRRSAI